MISFALEHPDPDSLQQLFQKMLKMKNGHHFQAKKTSATPDFCKQN